MHLVLIPHCMTEILAKECKIGKSTVLALGTVYTVEFLNKGNLPREGLVPYSEVVLYDYGSSSNCLMYSM